MTVQVGRSRFGVPEEEWETCLNSGVISGAMVAAAGIATIIARDPVGNIHRTTGTCIAIMPQIAGHLVHRLIQKTNGEGIFCGSVIGIAVPLLCGLTPVSYAIGSMTAMVSAVYISAFVARVLPPRKRD